MDPRDLYGLPLERFTEERNALARRLRADARREEAAAVAKLRKPSVAAWAVNQLVRTQKREIGALFKAGDALQKAQADVLSGQGDPATLRRSAEAERAALDSLAAKARGLLSAEGHELTTAKLDQVSETLHAAAVDPQARDQVRDGCLERQLRHVGLGALGAAGTTSAAERKSARKAKPSPGRERARAERAVEAARARRDRAAEALREAEQALHSAQSALDDVGR